MKNPGLRVFGAVMAPERPPTHPIWGDVNEDVDPDRRIDPDEEDYSDFMPDVNFGRWRNPGQSIRVPFRVNPPYQPGESPHDVMYGELLTKEDQDSADGILRGDHESDQPSGDPYVERAREDLKTPAARDAVETLSGLLSGGSPQDVGGLDEAHDYLSRHFTGVRVNPRRGTLVAHGPAGTQLAVRGTVKAPAITETPEEPAKPVVFSLTNRHGTFESPDSRRIVRTMVAFQIVHNALEAKRRKKKEEEEEAKRLTASSGFVHELLGGGLGKRIIRNLVRGVPAFSVPEDAVFEPGHGTDQNEKGQRGGWVSAHGLPGWHHDPESGAYYSPNHSMSEHLDPAKAMKPWPDPYHAGHTYTYMANPETGHTIERRKNGITYFVNSLHPSARGSGFDLPPQPPPPQQPKKTPMPNRYRGSVQSNDLCPVCASGYLEPYDREFHECLNCGSLVRHVGFERQAATASRRPARPRGGLGRGLGDVGPYEGDPLNLSSGGSENPENELPEGEYAHPLAGEESDPEYVGYEAPRNILDKRASGDAEDDDDDYSNKYTEREHNSQHVHFRPDCWRCNDEMNDAAEEAPVDENLYSDWMALKEPERPATKYDLDASVDYVAPKRDLFERLNAVRTGSAPEDADLVDEHLGKLGFQPIHKPGQSRTYVMQESRVPGSYFRVREGVPNAQGEPSGWTLTADYIPAEWWTKKSQEGEDVPVRSIPLRHRTIQPGKPDVFKQPLPDPGNRSMGETTLLASGVHPIDDDSLNRAIRDVAINGRGSDTYKRAIVDTAYEPPVVPRPGPGKTQRDLRGLSSVSNPGLMRFVG